MYHEFRKILHISRISLKRRSTLCFAYASYREFARSFARAKAIIAAITCASRKVSHRILRRRDRVSRGKRLPSKTDSSILPSREVSRWRGGKKYEISFVKIVARLLRTLGIRLRPYSSGMFGFFQDSPYLLTATTWKSSRNFKISTPWRNKIDLLSRRQKEIPTIFYNRAKFHLI